MADYAKKARYSFTGDVPVGRGDFQEREKKSLSALRYFLYEMENKSPILLL